MSETAPVREESARLYAEHRPVVVGAAYRVLGSLADAEDVAQETWLRWSQVPAEEVLDARGYLVRIATRLALNRLRELRRRREDYVGPWLPEPVGDLTRVGSRSDPEDAAVVADSVSMAMMVVLESLGPAERAAFVLHEVFAVPYGEIAESLDRSEPAVRQLVSRARARVRAGVPRHRVDRNTHAEVTRQFFVAAEQGDIARLTALLAPDAVLVGDGGGLRQAALRPLHGADPIARFLLGIVAKYGSTHTFTATEVNGEPALAVVDRAGGALDSVCVLTVDEGTVTAVYFVRNPEKLAAVGRAPHEPTPSS